MKLINLFFTFHALQFCLEAMFLVLKYDITNVKHVLYLYVCFLFCVFINLSRYSVLNTWNSIFFEVCSLPLLRECQKYIFWNIPFLHICNYTLVLLTNTIKADWLYQGNYKYLATFPDLISPSPMQYLFIHSSCVSSRL